MQRLNGPLAWTGALAALAGLLAGCTSDISLEDFNVARRATNFATAQSLSFSAPGRDFSVRPVTQADLVDAQGQCVPVASAPAAAAPDAAGDAAAGAPALVQGGIALQMTECDVVARAGQPDNIEFGNNERGERAVVLTYMRGPRPGIYRFAGGRLYSIERGPEPPAPPKKTAPAKKKRQAAVKSTVD